MSLRGQKTSTLTPTYLETQLNIFSSVFGQLCSRPLKMKKAFLAFLHFSCIYGQLFKIMLLPGDFWTVHVDKTFVAKTKIECASHCVAESVRF